MASTKVKAAIVLGAVGSAVGAYMIYDNLYKFYRAQDVPPLAGIFAVGLVLLGIGIGSLKHKALGLVPLVLGAGYLGLMIKLGKQHSVDMLAGFRHDIEIQKAAAAVCGGKPNTVAADAPVNGKRPLLGAGRRPGDAEWHSGGAAWADLPKPRSMAELQLVACTQQLDDLRAKCDYEGKDGVGAHSISRYRRVDHITVRLAKTGEVLGEKTFEGGEPSTDCATQISVRANSNGSTDVTGDPPDDKAETAFVRSFVEQTK